MIDGSKSLLLCAASLQHILYGVQNLALCGDAVCPLSLVQRGFKLDARQIEEVDHLGQDDLALDDVESAGDDVGGGGGTRRGKDAMERGENQARGQETFHRMASPSFDHRGVTLGLAAA